MRALTTLLAAAMAMAGGCARTLPEEPPPRRSAAEARRASCPPPLAWTEAEPRPLGVRIENRTEEVILVFLDGCWRHDRVGAVGPAASRLFRLPDRLVALPEGVPGAALPAGTAWGGPTPHGADPAAGGSMPLYGLRFHVFSVATLDHHSTHTLPVDTTTVLTLRVEPRAEPACTPPIFVDGEPFEGSLADLPIPALRNVTVRDFPRDPRRCREYHVTTR